MVLVLGPGMFIRVKTKYFLLPICPVLSYLTVGLDQAGRTPFSFWADKKSSVLPAWSQHPGADPDVFNLSPRMANTFGSTK